MNWKVEADRLSEQLVLWRRDFHMHPEIGLEVHRTAQVVAQELRTFGYSVTEGIANTGVVGVLDTGRKGPVVLIRADMDALPIQELNEVDYRSQNEGVMHACGHDAHIAIALGTASLLAQHSSQLNGVVKMMFQPGEEGHDGAAIMVEQGVLDRVGPQVDYSLATHVWIDLPVGTVSIAAGPVMAAADAWECTIVGDGGHGAAPHKANDPIMAAAQLITAWQTIVSRNVPPLESAVLSVGAVHGGEAFNIIPHQVVLRGTLRTYKKHVREILIERMEQVAESMCQAMNCSATLEFNPAFPVLENDPKVTQVVHDAASSIDDIKDIVQVRTMISEDMGFVHDQVPGCYFFTGARNEEKGLSQPHHNPRFNIDERVLPLAVELMCRSAAALMTT